MKKEHIDEIYKARRAIARNKYKMIDLMRFRDAEAIRRLREENELIRKKIQHRHGIMLDD